MEIIRNGRGFETLSHPSQAGGPARLAQQSSAIGDYEDAVRFPGSSFLWIGDRHHLNRVEVREFIARLETWLSIGSLELQSLELLPLDGDE